MRLRPAEERDGAALAELVAEMGYVVSPDDVVERLAALPRHHAVFVAEVDAEVAGWVHVYVDPSLIVERRAQLGGLSADAQSQGKGVASALLEAAERWSQEHGCSFMYVRSGAERNRAHEFYRRCGYGDVKDQLVLRKHLQP